MACFWKAGRTPAANEAVHIFALFLFNRAYHATSLSPSPKLEIFGIRTFFNTSYEVRGRVTLLTTFEDRTILDCLHVTPAGQICDTLRFHVSAGRPYTVLVLKFNSLRKTVIVKKSVRLISRKIKNAICFAYENAIRIKAAGYSNKSNSTAGAVQVEANVLDQLSEDLQFWPRNC